MKENSMSALHSNMDCQKSQERHFSEFLPEGCHVQTSSDAYYVATILCICLTFVFPPCVLVAGYCLYKAKKGGKK